MTRNIKQPKFIHLLVDHLHGIGVFLGGLEHFFDKDSGKALADVITLADEVISTEVDYEIFDPQFIWKRKTITNFNVKKLQERIFDKGELVYKMPSINEIKQYCKEQIDTLWEEVLRFENPHEYFVDLSEELWTMKIKLIDERKDRNLVK